MGLYQTFIFTVDRNSHVKVIVDSRLSESEMWLKLVKKVKTKYILVGRDIEMLHTKVSNENAKK